MVRGEDLTVLLDTCAFIWLCAAKGELSKKATKIIKDPSNDVFLSAVSTWEIVVKHSQGRLKLKEDPRVLIPRIRHDHGIEPLPLSEGAALFVSQLPPLHRDPFDRMLVSQASFDGMVILTPDSLIRQYPIRVEW
jgi:PIN domain nuclease of toxin-antitoxin system